jgi:hypothetical protein
VNDPAPFCTTPAAKRAFAAWQKRLEALGVELGEPDTYLVGLIASREARLEELAGELARCKDEGRRLRIVAAERLAAGDMAKALDQAERVFGPRVAEGAPAIRKAAHEGGSSIVPFPTRAGSMAGQRIVVALTKGGPMRKEALRKLVPGNQGDFLRGLKEAMASGAVVREGTGTKTAAFVYRAGASA